MPSNQECPACGAKLQAGVQYGWAFTAENPFHIDGVSEWIYECGHRVGRFSGNLLSENEQEPPYGDPVEGARRLQYIEDHPEEM